MLDLPTRPDPRRGDPGNQCARNQVLSVPHWWWWWWLFSCFHGVVCGERCCHRCPETHTTVAREISKLGLHLPIHMLHQHRVVGCRQTRLSVQTSARWQSLVVFGQVQVEFFRQFDHDPMGCGLEIAKVYHLDVCHSVPYLPHQTQFMSAELQRVAVQKAALVDGWWLGRVGVGSAELAVVAHRFVPKFGKAVVPKGIFIRALAIAIGPVRSTEMPRFLFHGHGPIAGISNHQQKQALRRGLSQFLHLCLIQEIVKELRAAARARDVSHG